MTVSVWSHLCDARDSRVVLTRLLTCNRLQVLTIEQALEHYLRPVDGECFGISPCTMQAGERGLFIVVEGLDRSGKTTQCQKLVDNISSTGKEVKYIKFPGISSLSHGVVLHC